MMKKVSLYIFAAIGFVGIVYGGLQLVQQHFGQPPKPPIAENNRNFAGNLSFVKSRAMYADTAYGEGSNGSAPASNGQRHVTRNASISLQVANINHSIKQIEHLVKQSHGWVVNSQIQQSDGPQQVQTASLQVRIPAKQLTENLQTLRQLAIKVSAQSMQGQDISRQYEDLHTRLATLEEAYKKLTHIMQQADRSRDVLNSYNQISSIQRQIDSVKGQINYYQQSIKYSLVQIQLSTSPMVETPDQQAWQLGLTAKQSWLQLKASIRATTRFIVWVVVYLLPLILLAAVILRLLCWLGIKCGGCCKKRCGKG